MLSDLPYSFHWGFSRDRGDGVRHFSRRSTSILWASEQKSDGAELVATRWRPRVVSPTIARKSGPPMHIHQTRDEFFYVVSGEFKVKLGEHAMSAPARP